VRGNKTIETKEIVKNAREIQKKRFSGHPKGIKLNSEMSARDIPIYTNLSKEAEEILSTSAKSLDLSARACHRIMKLSRTLADISGNDEVSRDNMLEAIRYRPKKQEII
jgi:magnesium chelatase family protein